MYKVLNHLIPPLDHHLFRTGSSVHSHDTPSKNHLRKAACRTKMRLGMIFSRAKTMEWPARSNQVFAVFT